MSPIRFPWKSGVVAVCLIIPPLWGACDKGCKEVKTNGYDNKAARVCEYYEFETCFWCDNSVPGVGDNQCDNVDQTVTCTENTLRAQRKTIFNAAVPAQCPLVCNGADFIWREANLNLLGPNFQAAGNVWECPVAGGS